MTRKQRIDLRIDQAFRTIRFLSYSILLMTGFLVWAVKPEVAWTYM